jgi:hypothetical protein
MDRPRCRCQLVMVAVLLSFILSGCMAHYSSTRVGGEETLYHVDEKGNKSKVYTTHKDGSVEIHDPNDPKAQELIAQREIRKRLQEKAAQRERRRLKAQQERDARIQAARKRNPATTIYVRIHETELGPKFKKAERPKGVVSRTIAEKIDAHRLIRSVNRNADVEVYTKAYFKELTGLKKGTLKPVRMVAFVLEATVRSNYLSKDVYTIEEKDNFIFNERVVKRAVEQINNVITRKIGRNIPADRKQFL